MNFSAAFSNRVSLGARLATILVLAGGWMCPGVAAAPLYPDLFAWEDEAESFLHDGTFDTTLDPTKVFYRFTAAIANAGAGPFEIHDQNLPDGTQEITQRVFDSEGGFTDTLIATLPIAGDQPFGHLHFSGLAQYNLRQVTTGGGVGDLVSTHDKTSFGIVDSTSYDLNLPGAADDRVYIGASDRPLGISVGWADLYHRQLPGQWANVTGLPSGEYWLEVVIDPYNRVLEGEGGEDNNITRVLVDLEIPDAQLPEGDYNHNGTVDAADYTRWRDSLGVSGIVPVADGDGNGVVNQLDYDLWAANFGATSNGQAAVNSPPAVVPEPGSLALLLVATGPFWHARRRRFVPR